MLRFGVLDRLGVTAAISGVEEGDCSRFAPESGKARFLEKIGLPAGSLMLPRQVHGDHVAVLRGTEECAGEADGVATNHPGMTLGITVADCVPVLLYCEGPRCAAAVHAGREGTRVNISQRAVECLRTEFGADPATLHAVIGPSAGPCCYEVAEALAADWRSAMLPLEGRRLDLWGANRMQLECAGVAPERIHVSGVCTICGEGFHSYRGTGTASRNLAIIHFG